MKLPKFSRNGLDGLDPSLEDSKLEVKEVDGPDWSDEGCCRKSSLLPKLDKYGLVGFDSSPKAGSTTTEGLATAGLPTLALAEEGRPSYGWNEDR